MSPEQCLINRVRNEILAWECGEQTIEETADEIRVASEDYAEACQPAGARKAISGGDSGG